MFSLVGLLIGAWIGRVMLRRKYRKLVAGGFDLNRAFSSDK